MAKEEKMNQLQLHDFWFDKISLTYDKTKPIPTKDGDVFNQTFKRTINKIDENNAVVNVSFALRGNEESPISIDASVCGRFECEKWESNEAGRILMTDNATAILFPYLRHAVSDLTTLSGLPPLIIPVMNIAQLFKDQEQK